MSERGRALPRDILSALEQERTRLVPDGLEPGPEVHSDPDVARPVSTCRKRLIREATSTNFYTSDIS